MRFLQFSYRGGVPRLGVQKGKSIFDLNALDSSIPDNLVEFLRKGQCQIEKVKKIINENSHCVPIEEIKILPPVTNPDKIICIALNYKGHCMENNIPIPKEPIYFSKFSSCIIGPYDDIKYPVSTTKLDWEVELAVIIGKKGYNIPQSESENYIFGYTIAQDISARDWQKTLNGGQFLLGKAMDTFCPLGPAVVHKDSIKNIYNLDLKTKVNGVLKQESNTSDIIHKIDYLISRFSRCVTLLPGDIILTGTPSGVGVTRDPPEFLKPDDVITSEIEEIGIMENKVKSF